MSDESVILGVDMGKPGTDISRVVMDYDLYQRMKTDAAIGQALLTRIGQPAVDALMSGDDNVHVVNKRYAMRLDKPQKHEG